MHGRPSGAIQEIADIHDVGMLNAGRGLGLDAHSINDPRVPGVPQVHDLHGELAPKKRMLDPIDLTHTSATEKTGDAVRGVGQHSVDVVGHRANI